MENFSTNEQYGKSYDIFEPKKNDKKVGNLCIKDHGIEVKIFPDNQINIQKLNKAKTYQLKNKKIQYFFLTINFDNYNKICYY